jgi:single-stranded-DNA-specific exonuclease
MIRLVDSAPEEKQQVCPMPRHQWLEPAPNEPADFDLTDYPLLSQILARRGVSTSERARSFLKPDLADLGDPDDLPDLGLAAERLRFAIARRQPIAIFGDYDVDGLTSTALLTRVLNGLGARVRTYVPSRIHDGYGLNRPAVDRIVQEGASLLLTVDCGTSNGEELAAVQRAGVETIVLDHHHVAGHDLPNTAFVSPRRPCSRYPFPHLAAVGVSCHLVRALVGDDAAANMLPLVALGTVADVVPLVGDNRVIVRHGLARFASQAPIGLHALARHAGIDPELITSWHLGFILGPRINAAGRMGDPQVALDLLLTDDETEAMRLAGILGRLNTARQRTMEQMIAQAEEKVRQYGHGLGPLLVLADGAWSIGLVGLVASRLVERYHRPTIVLERGPVRSRGSARSIQGIDIAAALAECHDLLLEHGGHSMAAGLTVETERLVELEDRLVSILDRTVGDEMPKPQLQLDAELHRHELSLETKRLLDVLEPCGYGNPEPRFFTRGLSMRNPRISRDGNHLFFDVPAGRGKTIRAAFFNGGDALRELASLGRFDLAFSLRRSVWQGRERVELDVLDFRPSTVP